MKDEDAPKKPVTSKIVYQNPWIKIHEDTTVDTAGNSGIYGYLESRNSCMVVAVDNQERIFMVRGFRYPSQSHGWELPGGGGDGEDLIEASRRELEEETGITATNWSKLGEAYVCNGLMTEKMAVCLATELRFDGEKELSSCEVFADMRFFDRDEIDELIRSSEINDCQTIAGLQYYDLRRKETRCLSTPTTIMS